MTDPLLTQTLQAMPATDVAAIEIRGYLVDWVASPRPNERAIREFVLMKDGSLRRIRIGLGRPAGSFGHVPANRLEPEPPAEASARKLALASAEATMSSAPPFGGVKPQVFAYLIRVRRASGAVIQVMVPPDATPAGFVYDPEISE